MTGFTRRGLPSSLALDGWWLSDSSEAAADRPKDTTATKPRALITPGAFAFLIALIALADFLFWKHAAGLSLILFSAGLTAAALVHLSPAFSARQWSFVLLLWLASALPTIEYVQASSLLFLIGGHLGLLVWCATRSPVPTVLRTTLTLPVRALVFAIKRIVELGASLGREQDLEVSRRAIAAWVLPLCVGSVFLVLFWGANPILERWLDQLGQVKISIETIDRMAFWAVTAVLVLPFVLFGALSKAFPSTTPAKSPSAARDGWLINAQSIINSLIIFNALFAFQNLTDAAYLWGGLRLPEDMTYASYAHRGAYPLMATSVLAGIFVLMSRPFVSGSMVLKALLALWILQNVFLVGSALARLGLYIDAYGLTYLRIRAGIGMMLVLAGMGLLLWQLKAGKSNGLIAGIWAGLFAATLYAGSFVNFGYVIANHNLQMPKVQRDMGYLCRYVPTGVKAFRQHRGENRRGLCYGASANWDVGHDGWRDWSYRTHRMGAHYEKFRRSAWIAPSTPLRDSDLPSE